MAAPQDSSRQKKDISSFSDCASDVQGFVVSTIMPSKTHDIIGQLFAVVRQKARRDPKLRYGFITQRSHMTLRCQMAPTHLET
jgi:hypothetical protein